MNGIKLRVPQRRGFRLAARDVWVHRQTGERMLLVAYEHDDGPVQMKVHRVPSGVGRAVPACRDDPMGRDEAHRVRGADARGWSSGCAFDGLGSGVEAHATVEVVSVLTNRDLATLARVLSSTADALAVDCALALHEAARTGAKVDALMAQQCAVRVASFDRAAPSQLARQAVHHAARLVETGPGRCSTRRRQAMRLASLADKLVTR